MLTRFWQQAFKNEKSQISVQLPRDLKCKQIEQFQVQQLYSLPSLFAALVFTVLTIRGPDNIWETANNKDKPFYSDLSLKRQWITQ